MKGRRSAGRHTKGERGAAERGMSFEEVVEQYYDRVFRLAYRMLHNYEEAADLTQDVFLHAFRGWQQFRGECEVYTWLYRITVNLCKNKLKQMERRRQVEGQSLNSAYSDDENSSKDAPPVEIEDWRNAPEVVMEQRELGRAIEEALNALPPEHRAIVVLRDIEGLSYEEIAKVLGCSVAAVKSRLFRARSHLREMLRPYLES